MASNSANCRSVHAAGGDEAVELGNDGVAAEASLERNEASLEHRALQPPDFDVVDVAGARERVDPGATLLEQQARVVRRGKIGHAVHVDVDRIEKAPVRRMVGARAAAILGEQRVQRIDPDDAASCSRRGLGDRRERGEVADALIAAPPQRIQVRGEAEATPAVANVGRQVSIDRERPPRGRWGRSRRRSAACGSRPAAAAA